MAHTATTVSIKKGDEVIVMTGKDRGMKGRVVNVLPRDNRIMVEGVARAKKASRPSKKRQQGGIIDIEQFIDLSNVQLVCKSCNKPTRVGHRVEDGVKIRVCRKCEADL
ncbi:MAG: 50S ribosomal protein L24 [Actinobacteria bacterium]|nr:50S ribosomal protein L24 [Actinomycetota bacterium]